MDMQQDHFVCILRCADGSLFGTLTTATPQQCVAEYNSGNGSPFGIGRRPVTEALTLYAGEDRSAALGLLYAIRNKSKSTKEKLVAGCPIIRERVIIAGEELAGRIRGPKNFLEE